VPDHILQPSEYSAARIDVERALRKLIRPDSWPSCNGVFIESEEVGVQLRWNRAGHGYVARTTKLQFARDLDGTVVLIVLHEPPEPPPMLGAVIFDHHVCEFAFTEPAPAPPPASPVPV
jgi:hypothetical protein